MTRKEFVVFNIKIWGSLALFCTVGLYAAYAYWTFLVNHPDSWMAVLVGPVMLWLVWWAQRGQAAYVDALAEAAIDKIRNSE